MHNAMRSGAARRSAPVSRDKVRYDLLHIGCWALGVGRFTSVSSGRL
jgi:hypothetical protein